jgi:hypothetical protein
MTIRNKRVSHFIPIPAGLQDVLRGTANLGRRL